MSYYSDASLVLIPSGYKDQKIYSAKPTDGSGDLVFSRASDATRVDSNGLIEKVRTNLILQSNTFDTTWTNNSTTDTSGQAGYDGSNDAWLLTATDTSSTYIYQSLSTNSVVTLSVYAKANTADFVELVTVGGGGANPRAWFNLSTGSVGTSYNVIDTNIEAISSGWYRCSITLSGSITSYRFYVTSADNSTSIGIGDSIYIQDAQLEQGLVATEYIETTTAAVSVGPVSGLPRLDYSGGASCPSLLLEPSRTNVIAHSEYLNDSGWSPTDVSVTSNYGTSPEGVQNSTRLVLSSTATGRMAESLTLTGGTTYTLSCWYKGTAGKVVAMRGLGSGGSGTDVVKTITLTGDWQREDLQFVAGSSSNVIYVVDSREITDPDEASDFEVYGVQVEAGSYATSYIPTYGTSVTRVADAAFLNNSAALPTAYPFTLFAECEVTLASDGQALTFSNTASSTEYFTIDFNAGFYRIASRPSTTQDSAISTLATTLGFHKICGVFTSTTIKLFVDGVLVASGANAQAFNASINDILVGQLRSISDTGNRNPVKQALVFKSALSDAQAIELTA